MLDNLTIQKLRDLPIEGVAEHLGLRVSKHTSLCPFHDDSHPSLTFDVRRNRFKCYVCDAHGGAIDLVEKKLGLGFKDACRWLADSSNVILEEWKPLRTDANDSRIYEQRVFNPEKYRRFFERPFISQVAGEFLFEKRHIDPRVVRWCRLTSYTDRNGIPWLQIPYFDIDGHLTGVQWRNLMRLEAATLSNPVRSAGVTNQESESGWKPVPRFRFPYGSQCHIYNLPVLKLLKPGEDLWIAEGCSDCWALLSSGRKAIAIPSATLLKPKDLEPIIQSSSSACPEPSLPRACRGEGLSFHMFPDADVPGERLFYKLKEQLPSLARHQLPDGYKDFGQYWAASQNVTTLPC